MICSFLDILLHIYRHFICIFIFVIASVRTSKNIQDYPTALSDLGTGPI